jgi:hypothetical protein
MMFMNMKAHKKYMTAVLIAALCICTFSVTEAASSIRGSFVYRLSSFSGAVPYNWSRVFIDKSRDEAYVLYQSTIRIFDKNGMEVYSFGDDLNLGAIVDAAVEKSGNIMLLTYTFDAARTFSINIVNYRGEPVSRMAVKGLPDEFSKFAPNRIIIQKDDIYLISLNAMKAAILDSKGNFREGYDLAAILKLDEKEKADNMLGGFSIDAEGNMLFTIPTLFKAYIVSPDRKVVSFGRPGGAPGRFAVVAGIISDDRGHYLVVDKLKCVISVYDKNFNFVEEFGFRGDKPGNLIAPDEIVMDSEHRIYVTQSRGRGVNVYRLEYQ